MGCLGLEGLNVASGKLVLRQVNSGKQICPALIILSIAICKGVGEGS
jgi:hypothetical protein